MAFRPVFAAALLLSACSLLRDRDDFSLEDGPLDQGMDAADGRVDTGDSGDGGGSACSARQGLTSSPYVRVESAKGHSCALRADGSVDCWGSNRWGQSDGLADGMQAPAFESPNRLRAVANGRPPSNVVARDVSVGDAFTCVLANEGGPLRSGRVYCVGRPIGAGVNDSLGLDCDATDFASSVHPCALDGFHEVLSPENPDFPEGGFVELASRGQRSCARGADGSLWCWGANEAGQAGPMDTLGPQRVVATDVTAIALAERSSCVLLATGHVACFGSNEQGELGRGALGGGSAYGEIASLENVRALVAGAAQFCALDEEEAVHCWGHNEGDFLGATRVLLPEPTLIGESASHLALLDRALCTWTEGGVATCRGYNDRGQFGDGRAIGEPSGFTRSAELDCMEDAGGARASCGLRDGDAVCWGYAPEGEVPREDLILEMPEQVFRSGSAPVAEVRLNGSGMCLRTGDGQAFCSGESEPGERPPASPENDIPFDGLERIPGLRDVLSIARAPRGACAVFDSAPEAQMRCWGDNSNAMLGFPETSSREPRFVPFTDALFEPTSVALGFNHGCGAVSEPYSAVFCWGENARAQTGQTSPARIPIPTGLRLPAGTLRPLTDVRVGRNFSCALVDRGNDFGAVGDIFCWGDDSLGQLGREIANVPLVNGVRSVSEFSLGRNHGCAIHDLSTVSGALSCWGDGRRAQLGPPESSPSPLVNTVPGLANVVAVAAGECSTCVATAEDLTCWGCGEFFQLGDGVRRIDDVRAQVQVNVPEPMVGLAAGGAAHCGWTAAGELWCWGLNDFNKLGTERSLFVPATVAAAR